MAVVAFRELVLDGVERLLPGDGKAPRGGDRLRLAVRRLRELGASVPAALPLAAALDRLAEDDVPALLDLLRMLRLVRANLAGAGLPGRLEPLAESGPWSTPASASELSPVLRWLRRSSWESGWQDVRAFCSRHTDLRLVGPFLSRLAQGSGEPGDSIAAEVLPRYGPALLPVLRRLLEADDRRTQARALRAICHINGPLGAELCRPRLSDTSAAIRQHALSCLRVAAPDEAKRTALAWLQRPLLVAEACMAWHCLHALRPMKARDLPVLLRAMTQRPGTWGATTETVASVGKPAVRPLTELLRAPDEGVRILAAEALGLLGARAVPAVPTLIDLIRDPDTRVLMSAAGALARIGPAARAAVPRLIEMLSGGYCCFAAEALVALGRDDADAAAAIVAHLETTDRGLLEDVINRVIDLGPAAKAAVPRLVALFRERPSNWHFRSRVANALESIGPAARAAIPVLEEALEDREVRVRYAAAVALGMIGPAGKAAVPVLIEAMCDEDDSWWWAMHQKKGLQALASIGRAAVPALAKVARTGFSDECRRAAGEALARIAGTS